MSLRYLDNLPEATARNRHSGSKQGEEKVSRFESNTEGSTKEARFTEEERSTRNYDHTRQRGQPYRERPYRARVPAELTALPYDSVKITRLPPLPTLIPSAPGRRSRDLSPPAVAEMHSHPPPAAHSFTNPQFLDAPFVLAPENTREILYPCHSRSDIPFMFPWRLVQAKR